MSIPARRSARALAFARAARTYWLGIWPSLAVEVRRWHRQATRIPDESLRALALGSLKDKRGNLEGAVAFATLSSPAWRQESIYAMASFEALFDYLDCLCEQPNPDPIASGKQINLALLLAVRPGTEHADYYALHTHHDDGGYLAMLIDRCRKALECLPSYAAVGAALDRAARRIATYQSLNHGDAGGSHEAFVRWARSRAARHQREHGESLYWWEIGASCGSSLGIFALIAAAARPKVSEEEVTTIERAYFPWIGAANSLLDSLVDQDEDDAPGQHLLLDYYASPEQITERLYLISREAASHASALPPSHGHTLILAAMIGFYLSHLEANDPGLQAIRDAVLSSVEDFGTPALAVMRSRRAAAHIKRRVTSPFFGDIFRSE